MLRHASNLVQNLFIGVLVFFIIIFETYFLSEQHIILTVNLSIGFVVGFYICFGNDILKSIIIATLLGKYVGNVVILDMHLVEAIPHSLIYLIFTLILAIGLGYTTKYFDCSVPTTFKKGIIYILLIAFFSLVASMVPSTLHMISDGVPFVHVLKSFIKPTSVGIGVYGTLIVFSTNEDEPFGESTKSHINYILWVLFFSILTYMSISGSLLGNNFIYLAPVMLILFMVHAFAFNYRTLILSASAYILSYSLLLKYNSVPNPPSLVASFNLLLIAIMGVTIFSKFLISRLTVHNEVVEESNRKLESMMESTFDLFKVSDFVSNETEAYTDVYLNNIFKIVTQLFTKAQSGICVRTEGNKIHVIATKGYELETVSKWNMKRGTIVWNFETPVHSTNMNDFFERIIENDYELYSKSIPKIKESLRFVVPLGKNEFGGITIDIHKSSKATFNETDIDNIAHLQKMLTSYYEKNQLLLKNTSLKDDIVLSLIRTLELYDQYTGGHSEEVADLSRMIAEEMNLSHDDIYNIYWAGIVHDIGKIGVDPKIINKNSRLTIEEYEEIKLHPVHGYSILNRSEDLRTIAKLVKHHHEWWNGCGYPNKLKQDEIPFGSQILQVADSVSSMATKRSYSNIKSLEEIREELEMYSSTQFSPYVASTMIRLIDNGSIKEYYDKRRK